MAGPPPSSSLVCNLVSLRRCAKSASQNKHASYRCALNRHTARQGAVLQAQRRRGGPKHGGEMGTRQECRLLRASDGIPRVASTRRCTSLPLGTAHAPRRRHLLQRHRQNERRAGNRMNGAIRLQQRRQQIQVQPWFKLQSRVHTIG